MWSSTGGTTKTEYPAPGVVKSIDAVGYVKELTSDTHGRLVAVRQGEGTDPLVTTGAYTWDGRGRLLTFTDGNGNQYRYDYDGAGRRRQVWRTAPNGVEQAYMGFAWDGPDPIEQYEGAAGDLSALVATWTYDPLGRTTGKQLWDPVAGDWQAYTWVWDLAWIGARQATTDPLGTTTYTYDPLAVVGGFGWPTHEERTWSGSAVVAAITPEYDANGRVTKTTWPTGANVATTYWSDGPPDAHEVRYGNSLVPKATVALSYDEIDRPDGWTVTMPKVGGRDPLFNQERGVGFNVAASERPVSAGQRLRVVTARQTVAGTTYMVYMKGDTQSGILKVVKVTEHTGAL